MQAMKTKKNKETTKIYTATATTITNSHEIKIQL